MNDSNEPHEPSPTSAGDGLDPQDAANRESAANDLALLRQGCEQLGISLGPAQEEQFQRYFELLAEWNEKINLTAIIAYADVQVKHFLDSVAALPIIAEEVGETGSIPARNLHVVDVGSGAGFPGIPLAILAPHLRITLMDGTGKKVQFLQRVVNTLGLPHVQVVQGRAEELARQSAYRGQFDVVTARAVAPLNTLVEYLLPLARRGGLVVAYKGGSAAQEFMEARSAIETLGGEPVRFAPVTVPFLNEQRFILLIRKTGSTPGQYPRAQGLARKKPL